jgi:hypothetical protein
LHQSLRLLKDLLIGPIRMARPDSGSQKIAGRLEKLQAAAKPFAQAPPPQSVYLERM